MKSRDRPDIQQGKNLLLLINVAIPSDRNVIHKEAEKKLKHKNLSVEIQQMLSMKCFVIPVVIMEATEIISKSLKKYL
jgi:hypothetical protein